MYWTKAGTPATYFINKNNAALGKSMPSGLSGLSKLVMFSLSIKKYLYSIPYRSLQMVGF